ncbi:MAG: cyclase family protein [Patescibacteria group bacterium]|mgnify:CR=1 FL=1
MKIYDISRSIGKETPIYPGDPAFELNFVKKLSVQGLNVSRMALGLHTATHCDAPSHHVKNGRTIEKIDLEKCLGWCRVVNMTNVKAEIEIKDIKRIRPKAGEIIIFRTKNSLAKTKRFDKTFVSLSEAAARFLVKSKIKAVGIDGPSIKKFRLRPDSIHPLLLRAGIPIYEGLQLAAVKPKNYFFVGLPLKIVGAEASPVRAILIYS